MRRWVVMAALCAGVWAPGAQAQVRQGLVSLPDARLFYEVVGSGDPIVVVHGGPGLDHRYLRPGLDVLASGHALVYYDQRGTGRSGSALDSTAINLTTFIEDIESLREALGYEQITVLGHSFGGLLALGYALEHPDRTRALILMNSVEPGSRWRTEAQRRAAASRTPADSAELARLATSPAFAAGNPDTVSQVYRIAFRGTLRDSSRVADLDLKLSRSTARDGGTVARLLGTAAADVDWWDRLPDLQVPTLVVAGRYDPTPLPMARALAEAVPHATLSVLGTGHFPYVEDPSSLATAVATFLAGVGR